METIKTQIKSKFLQTCIGISMIFLSAGFFVHSITPAMAAPTPMPAPNLKLTHSAAIIKEYPFGIANGYAYWLEDDGTNWNFMKKPLTDFKL